MSTEHLDACLRLASTQARFTRRFDGALSAHHGLSFTDFSILVHLSRTPDRRLRRVDLAEQMQLTPSGVTRLLGPLERIGLVGRESSDRDARVAFATLTDAGARVLEEATETAERIAADLLAGASVGRLNEVLVKL
jgi:DNA-binding MarR family transcriptional regulator